MKEQQSHWWPLSARYTACGQHVHADTICSPDPTCAKCREWLVLDAQSLARQLEPEPEWVLDAQDQHGFRLILEDEDDHHGPR